MRNISKTGWDTGTLFIRKIVEHGWNDKRIFDVSQNKTVMMHIQVFLLFVISAFIRTKFNNFNNSIKNFYFIYLIFLLSQVGRCWLYYMLNFPNVLRILFLIFEIADAWNISLPKITNFSNHWNETKDFLKICFSKRSISHFLRFSCYIVRYSWVKVGRSGCGYRFGLNFRKFETYNCKSD